MPWGGRSGRIALFALLLAVLTAVPLVSAGTTHAVPPARAGVAPGPSAGGASLKVRTGPALPAPAVVAPPPPYDWDPMYFHANNSTGVPAAGGGGAQLVADDPGGFAIMFGGATPAAGISNATWLVNETSAIWYLLPTPVAPSKRLDFSMSSGGRCGVAVLFGGEVNPSTHQATNDTWVFNFTTKQWTNVTQSVAPAPRSGAALAIDDATCQAVLYGGADIDYTSGNSTGSVRWNDTWVLNLSTDVWTHRPTRSTPPSVADAGFLFDNASDIFLLYGGCESLCSAAIWQFNLTTGAWTARPDAAMAPPARGGADWVYGWTHDVAVLSMGYDLTGSSRTAYNDTYVYEIDQNRWDPVGNPTPTPRYYAPGVWLGANGCPGFVLVGGAGAPTDPPDEWILDEAPDVGTQCNTWGNDSISTGGNGQGFGCDFDFFLLVTVNSSLTGRPIAGANVSVVGNCSRASQPSDRSGEAAFLIAFAPYTVVVTDPTYHTNATPYLPTATPNYGWVNLTLVPLPNLTVNSFERAVSGVLEPLANVTVTDGAGDILGITDPVTASLNVPGYWPLGLYETFHGNRSGFGDADTTSAIPYTGNWTVNLTLGAPGPIDVRVVEDGTGVPLGGAVVTVTTVPTEPRAGFRNLTDADGWTNNTVVAGNFTATAKFPGYAVVRAGGPFEHPWAAVTVVTINMTSDLGFTVDVRVLNSVTLAPLPGAEVQVGAYAPRGTGPSGWANLSGIRPGGGYEVVAWATNFSTNRTSVLLSFSRPVWVVIFELTPLKGCSTAGTNCTLSKNGATPIAPLALWPSSEPALSLVTGGGLLLFLLPATALILARRRGGPRAPGGGRP